jgi:hypothetical protein
MVVDGVLFKSKEVEVTSDEKSAILELSPFVNIGSLRRILHTRWPNVGFDADLLYRLKGNTERFWKRQRRN